MATCTSCGHPNPADARFCAQCGSPLAQACPTCGRPHAPDDRFCVQCGTAFAVAAPAEAQPAPVAERRLVSVLFADLVGFTSLSEHRDPEEVRELLSRYFETCNRLIGLYGGTVEKFIGDAVMAVWGTPTATEDDAERAVRAALDLTAAVSALGDEIGAPELRARAGVLTGEAAVTIGAEGQGMVAGDLVNTASRIQSAADPGMVLVGETTRRTTEQTIVYEDAGTHMLKGKDEPVALWRALRVVSGTRGSLKSQGLEAPFVGRDRELRRVKDLFHECEAGGKAHLVSVTGIAGIGKSRLAWEFYKYFDGIAQVTYWHRGRCLSYGEGVTYWALADMVRMRCRIGEDDEPAAAREKLRVALEEHLTDADERAFVEPRLAHLLGLAEHAARDKQDLFAAWRLFFERLADVYPTILAFEDMQWADLSLLDFVEYLLEWSRNSPLFVVTLARPEFAERRPTWGAGLRNFTSLYLEPLDGNAMEELLDGLVPGLPEATRAQILARAEGVPLYAVETVRMLLDRGLLAQDGAVYRPVGEIGELQVPETLHALIAARLDGLSPEERRLLADGAVLGKTFTADGLRALSGLAAGELEPLLGSLVRKEVLGLQADPRSPEHGQYGFLQDLVRHVAYETLSRHERRARHLAAAAYLREAFAEDDEVAEVVAAHYVDAYDANPDAADAGEVRRQAHEALVRAGDRAASLAALGEARRYLVQAAGLTDDARERGALLDRAAWYAFNTADHQTAVELGEQAIAAFEEVGDTHAAARASGRLANVESALGRADEGLARIERAWAVVGDDEPDEDIGQLAVRFGAALVFAGELDRAAEQLDRATAIGEALGSPLVLAGAFNMRSVLSASLGRQHERLAFVRQAIELAREHELEQLGSMYFNHSDAEFARDRYESALDHLDLALAEARRRGSRAWEWSTFSEIAFPLFMLGRWDEAVATAADVPEDRLQDALTLSLLESITQIRSHRGDVAGARRLLSLYPEAAGDVQYSSSIRAAEAGVLLAEGRFEEAFKAALETLELVAGTDDAGRFGNQQGKQALVFAIEAAIGLGRSGEARELVARVERLAPGARPPFLDAQAKRFRGRLEGDAGELAAATTAFDELGMTFWAAVSRLEHGELVRDGNLIEQARAEFERLGATPWLERTDRALAAERVSA